MTLDFSNRQSSVDRCQASEFQGACLYHHRFQMDDPGPPLLWQLNGATDSGSQVRILVNPSPITIYMPKKHR